MTPEELATLFKRRGDFDSTRKDLLVDFQNSTVGQQFALQLDDILQECIDKDPSLLRKEKSDFHQLMVERITKSSEYKQVQQFVDSLLQPAQYMSKIENKLRTIVQEQAPPVEPIEEAQTKEPSRSKEAERSKPTKVPKETKETKDAKEAKEAKETKESKDTKKAETKASSSEAKREGSLTAKTETLVHELPETPRKIKEEPDTNPQRGNSPDPAKTQTARNESSDVLANTTSRKLVPKKRNSRRQSMDSNSSLSSPPSSSDQDSDNNSGRKDVRRAKKISKKAAPRNKEESHSSEVKEQSAEPVESSIGSKDDLADGNVSMDMSALSNDKEMDVDSTAMDIDESSSAKKDPGQSEPAHKEPTKIESPPEKDKEARTIRHGSPSDRSHGDMPSLTSSYASLPRSPAATGANSVSVQRRRESESADKKYSREHSQGLSTIHKRTGHLPLPLPPRPTIVPLPPKPILKHSISRRTSHSRSTSAVNAGSSTAISSSASAVVTTQSALSTSPSLSFSSNRLSGRTKPDHESHLPTHPSLPPPPHNLQHPLPPTPRPVLSGSKQSPLSSKTPGTMESPPSNRTAPSSTTTTPGIPTTPQQLSAPSADISSTPKIVASASLPRVESVLDSGVDSDKPTSNGLKPSGSNSSSDSLSSTGSLASSTGSLTTDGSADAPLISSTEKAEENSKGERISRARAGSPLLPPPEPPATPPAAPAPPPPPSPPTPPPPPPESSHAPDAGSSEEGATSKSPRISAKSPAMKPSAGSEISESVKSPDTLRGVSSLKSPPRVLQQASLSSPTSAMSSPSSSGQRSRHQSAAGAVSGPGLGSGTPSTSTLPTSSTSTGRATIPLPHKPIPLPPKPSGSTASGSTTGASGGHSRHHHQQHHHHGSNGSHGHRKHRY